MDALSLVIDLTRRPANPFSYLKGIAGLLKAARALGLTAHPIVLFSGPELELQDEILKQAKRVGGKSPKDAWKAAAAALGGDLTLVLSSGAIVTDGWLKAALELLRSTARARVVTPEIGAFHWRGRHELLSFAREQFGRYRAPLLGIGEFAPVALGPSASMAELLSLGVFGSEPLTGGSWLQSWLKRDLIAPLEGSVFFMDADLSPLVGAGTLRYSPVPPAPPDWLVPRLRELAEIDPRSPVGERTPTLLLGGAFASDAEEEVFGLENRIAQGAGVLLVTGPLGDQGERDTRRLLIESVAATHRFDEIPVLVVDSEEKPMAIGPGPISLIGVGRSMDFMSYQARARVLAAIIAAREPERVHLLDSDPLAELLAALAGARFRGGPPSVTVLPRRGWLSQMEGKLRRPEFQRAIREMGIVTFSEEQARTLGAYGEAEPLVCSPWEPAEWRQRVFGSSPSGDADLGPDDSRLAMRLSRFSGGAQLDELQLLHALEDCGRAVGEVSLPVGSGFLCLYRSPRDLPDSPVFVARDGALPLSLFFKRCPTPEGYVGKLLVAPHLSALVPEAWKASVLYYGMRSTRRLEGKLSRLILFGLAHEPSLPLGLIESELRRLVQGLGEALSKLRIECYFPHAHQAWGCERGSIYPAEFVRAIRRGLPGKKVSWLDEDGFAAVQGDSVTVFHELGSGVLSSLTSLRWSLLSRGVAPLDSENEAEASFRIAASPWHRVEAFEPGPSADAHLHRLQEAVRPLARSSSLVDLLERARAR
jgi:hypothetical protein